jgi:hypothetical protein
VTGSPRCEPLLLRRRRHHSRREIGLAERPIPGRGDRRYECVEVTTRLVERACPSPRWVMRVNRVAASSPRHRSLKTSADSLDVAIGKDSRLDVQQIGPTSFGQALSISAGFDRHVARSDIGDDAMVGVMVPIAVTFSASNAPTVAVKSVF